VKGVHYDEISCTLVRALRGREHLITINRRSKRRNSEARPSIGRAETRLGCQITRIQSPSSLSNTNRTNSAISSAILIRMLCGNSYPTGNDSPAKTPCLSACVNTLPRNMGLSCTHRIWDRQYDQISEGMLMLKGMAPFPRSMPCP